MQKLDFNDEGKLVAYTDNGCTDGKSAITEIKGTFEVSADVVNFILAKEYDLPASIRIQLEKKESVYHYSYEHLYCYIGNDVQQEFDEQKKLLQDYKQLLGKMENELKRLRKAIDDFNNSRRFYERKIKNV